MEKQIKKSKTVIFMLTSIPVGILVWFFVFYYLKGDYVLFRKATRLGMTISVIMIFISRLILTSSDYEKKRSKGDYFSIIDMISVVLGYLGLIFSFGVIIVFFL